MSSLLLNLIVGFILISLLFWFILNLVEKINKNNPSPKNIKQPNFEINHRNSRSYDRQVKNIDVQIKRNNHSNESFKAVTKDVSLTGAFIICNKRVDVNEKIEINFFNKQKKYISVFAKVVWSNTNLPEKKIIIPGFGVQFLEMKNDKRQLLYNFFQ